MALGLYLQRGRRGDGGEDKCGQVSDGSVMFITKEKYKSYDRSLLLEDRSQ